MSGLTEVKKKKQQRQMLIKQEYDDVAARLIALDRYDEQVAEFEQQTMGHA